MAVAYGSTRAHDGWRSFGRLLVTELSCGGDVVTANVADALLSVTPGFPAADADEHREGSLDRNGVTSTPVAQWENWIPVLFRLLLQILP